MKSKTRFWEVENTGHENIISSRLLDETIPKWLFRQKKEMN